mgnify:CR=1 FL=1
MVTVDLDVVPVRPPRRIPGPWWALAGGGAVAVLAAGWIVLGGGATLGWLGTPDVGFGSVLRLATQWLALAHGVPAEFPPLAISIVPLGVTLLLVALSMPIASLAARQAASTSGVSDGTGHVRVHVEPIVWRVGAVFAATYTATLLLVTTTVLGTATGWRALLGGALVGTISGLWGAARGVGYDLTARLPRWAHRLPSAVGLALSALVAGGATVLVVVLWAGRAQMELLIDSLGGGTIAAVLLLALQLAYLPNAVLWCVSWLLGAGVQLGEGTSITMAGSEVGFLPAVPLLGAVPEEIGPWAYAWLAVGVVAGALTATAVVLGRPRAHPVETTLVGAIGGLASSAVVLLLCLVSGGGLGPGRLAWLGPDLNRLVLFPPIVLGISGALAGLLIGAWLRPVAKKSAGESVPVSADEEIQAGEADPGPVESEDGNPPGPS